MFDFQQISCMAAGFSPESWKIPKVFQVYEAKLEMILTTIGPYQYYQLYLRYSQS